ncbi:MAG TPA: NAD(P)-binding protein [Bryobacteraceae bacterium]|jgi:spermidine dehydrogenase
MGRACPHLDKILGLNERISRRDFLDGALLASGGALLSSAVPRLSMAQNDWIGYTGEGDYRLAAGNTEEVVLAAHAVRDGKYDDPPASAVDTEEIFDCVIVGGGFSGLSAALFFTRQAGPGATCLVLDNAAVFGGVAKRNEFVVDGHRLYAPQASVHFQPPYPHSFLKSVYDAMGMDFSAFKDYQTWRGPTSAIDLSRSPYRVAGMEAPTYGFYFGAKFGRTPGVWVVDPWGRKLEECPFPEKTKQEMLAWRHGHRVEPAWRYEFPGDEISRKIDSVTLEEYYMRTLGLERETVRLLYTHDTAGGLGLGPDALSGFCEYAWSSIPTTDDSAATGWQMFPGGNSGMTRLIVKTLIPEAIEGPRSMEAVWKSPIHFASLDQPGQRARIRLRSTVVRVEHDGEAEKAAFVRVTYNHDGKLYRVKARAVVMAGGGWMTKHVLRDLDAVRRAAYATFCYSPYLVANVAIRNWNFLYKLGISGGQWFDGFGSFVEVRKMAKFGVDDPYAGPEFPTVLTFFVDFAKPGLPALEQGHRGRTELLSTSYRDYERVIREQMTEMFSASGFDAKRDIAGIVLNRWGHAFINPQPGFFFGKDHNAAPRDALRNGPFGRIVFSHADLSGAMDHRNAFMESHRAVGQLLNQVLA